MSETDNKIQTQKPKTCRLAVTSLVLAISAFPGILVAYYNEPFGYDTLEFISRIFLVTSIPIILMALTFSIISIVILKNRQGELKGDGYATGGIVLSIVAVICTMLIILPRVISVSPRLVCGTNLSELGKALLIYASDNNEKYPTPDKWCDLLIENGHATREKSFRCQGNNKELCSFAINPNVTPRTHPRTVLLFETKGGWNQFGGPELLTTENHRGEGCNIVFNDLHVEFVKPEDFGKLKWKAEESE